jgi:hypothetical protein
MERLGVPAAMGEEQWNKIAEPTDPMTQEAITEAFKLLLKLKREHQSKEEKGVIRCI